VTALPLLLDPQLRESFDVARATDFLTAQSGRESGFVYRARLFLLGEKVLPGGENPGWPWYPETAAWVSPTALTILALEKAQRERPSETLAQRCESGRLYLKAHRCADGGWNHGSSQALGYDAGSYPETTGLALLALHGEEGLLPSLSLADRYLPGVRSMEAASWLRLGLLAHRRPIPEDATGRLHPRTTVDLALGLLAEAASHGKNAFLD
jgi:hypothetical protein